MFMFYLNMNSCHLSFSSLSAFWRRSSCDVGALWMRLDEARIPVDEFLS